jgi:hypothetical protein
VPPRRHLDRAQLAQVVRIGLRIDDALQPVAGDECRPLVIDHLAHPDIGVEIVRMPGDELYPEAAAPGMAEQDHALDPEAAAQVVEELARIAEITLEPHRRGVKAAVVRLARAALVPVHHHEMPLECAIKMVGERHLRPARPAMQPEQHRIVLIGAADQDPLPHAAELHGLQRRDAVRQRAPVRTDDRRSRA